MGKYRGGRTLVCWEFWNGPVMFVAICVRYRSIDPCSRWWHVMTVSSIVLALCLHIAWDWNWHERMGFWSSIGVAFCAVFEFQKSSHLQPLAATRVAASGRKWPLCRVAASDPQVAAFDAWPRCFNLIKSSHLQPLAATRVAASGRFSPSGRKWPQVAALSSGRNWPQVAAFDAWPRCFNLIKSSHLQPHSSGRKWPAFPEWPASGREWPPLPHNVMNSKLRKTPTRSRRQPTYPSQLEKKHLSNKTYFFKMFIGKEDEWLDTSLSSKGQA